MILARSIFLKLKFHNSNIPFVLLIRQNKTILIPKTWWIDPLTEEKILRKLIYRITVDWQDRKKNIQ